MSNFLQRFKGLYPLSLRFKIIILCCVISFATSFIIAGFFYYRMRDMTYKLETDNLAGETRLLASKLEDLFDLMANDTFIIANTPPIQGIIRSQKNNAIDPFDQSTLILWQRRLSTIFRSLIAHRDYYTQIRLIGLAKNGLEIVRVNRSNTQIKTVPSENLQTKGNENYFAASKKLKPGQVVFSQVTYNREYNRIDPELIATIRAIIPIFDDQTQKQFGLLVINANYEAMLKYELKKLAPNKDVIILNSNGNYLEYNAKNKNFRYVFNKKKSRNPSPLIRHFLNIDLNEQSFIVQNVIAHYVRLKIDSDASHDIGVILTLPKSSVLSAANSLLLGSMFLALLITILVMSISAFIASVIMLPLTEITQAVIAAQKDNEPLKLKYGTSDEIDKLALAFEELTNSLYFGQEKINALFENVADGIMIVNKMGVIDSCNLACEAIFGYKTSELIGMHIKQLLTPNNQLDYTKPLGYYLKLNKVSKTSAAAELECVKKDGVIIDIELSASEIIVRDNHYFTGVIRDITEKKQLEIIKNEFISTVNHELRTPLTSIKASLAMLKNKKYKKHNEERLIELAYDNTEHLNSIVNDILDMEKIASGKFTPKLEVHDLSAVLNNIVEHNQGLASQYNITFNLNYDSSKTQLLIDLQRFNQAMNNLLSNAAKFSPIDSSVSIESKLKENNTVIIAVKDAGPGIPKDFAKKIFGRFAQSDSSNTRKVGGTGLGLYITKQIIEAMNGKIYFKNNHNKGVTFFIELPLVHNDKESWHGRRT